VAENEEGDDIVTNGKESNDRLDRIEAALASLTARHDALTTRNEALTARHEALSETVVLIAGMQAKNEEAQAKNEKLLAEVLSAIHSLARIAQAHEQRLDKLEG
jgi:hypothetical protein